MRRIRSFTSILLLLWGGLLPSLVGAAQDVSSPAVSSSSARTSSADGRTPAGKVADGTAGTGATRDEAGLPVARSAANLSTVAGIPVAVDGSASYDPGGRRITFRWQVAQAPSASMATIEASDPAPVFMPDKPGIYALQLVVTTEDGLESRPARTTVVAFESRGAPNARSGRDRDVSVGAEARLDAGASFDPLNSPLTFLWSLISAPLASTITDDDILRRNSAEASFVPDVAGPFVLGLEASNGELTAEDRVTITATRGNLPPVADAGDHQLLPGVERISLRGEASFDPDAHPAPLAFGWSLVARPAGSSLTSSDIAAANVASASVMPDVAGAYVFRLTITDGERSSGDNVLVRVATDTRGDSADSASQARAVAAAMANRGARSSRKLGDPAKLGLSVTPLELRVERGGQASFKVQLSARSSGVASATVSINALPASVTAVFASPTVSASRATTLKIAAARDMPAARYPMLVTARATVDGVQIEQSVSVTVVVIAPTGSSPVSATCGAADLSPLSSKVYVSPKGSDTNTCGGSTATACLTVQQGIDRCAGPGCGVLVRYGRYPTTDTIGLKNGVNVYGGCLFTDSPPPDSATAANYRSEIDASPKAGAAAISATSINTPTLLHGLVVLAKDESAAGQASIAVVLDASKGVTLTNVTLIAGRGGSGAPGQTAAAAGGVPGSSPASALSIVGGAGGAACVSNPQSSAGHGGAGADYQAITADCGDWWCTCTNSNAPSSTGRSGATSGTVNGGVGGVPGASGCGCLRQDNVPDGPPGLSGAPGACGVAGGAPSDAFGTVVGSGWKPGTSGTGASGSVGSGGGGGGSGGMSAFTNFHTSTLYPGLPGGGGGGGGCGGAGGTGGGQGGASIALLLVNSSVGGGLIANSLVPGPGGTGGTGGTGGVGGMGAAGATGFPGHTIDVGRESTCTGFGPGGGGAGGAGGQGGAGGGGGAGTGGPSIGIALVAGSSNPSWQTIYAGLPGTPGTFGSGGQNTLQPGVQPNPCKGTAGRPGAVGGSASIIVLDQTPSSRLLLPGEQLTTLQSIFSPNGFTELILQDDGNLCVYQHRPSGRTPTWCSHTNFYPMRDVTMQPNGDLVIHDNDGKATYSSGTGGHSGSYLAVQDDGNVQIWDGLSAIWLAFD